MQIIFFSKLKDFFYFGFDMISKHFWNFNDSLTEYLRYRFRKIIFGLSEVRDKKTNNQRNNLYRTQL